MSYPARAEVLVNTIRLFSVISRILVERCLTSQWRCSPCIQHPQPTRLPSFTLTLHSIIDELDNPVFWLLLFYALQDFYSNLKSLLVSRTVLSILADLSNAVVWWVSILSRISKPLRNVQNAPITIGIAVTLMFHNFLISQPNSKYLSLLLLSFVVVVVGTRGVMVIVVGNGYRDTSSNPGRDWLHFT